MTADWRRVLEVNLTGPFLMGREFGKEMLRQGSGSIVNISSVAGPRRFLRAGSKGSAVEGTSGAKPPGYVSTTADPVRTRSTSKNRPGTL